MVFRTGKTMWICLCGTTGKSTTAKKCNCGITTVFCTSRRNAKHDLHNRGVDHQATYCNCGVSMVFRTGKTMWICLCAARQGNRRLRRTETAAFPQVFSAVWPSAPDTTNDEYVNLVQELHLWNLHRFSPLSGHRHHNDEHVTLFKKCTCGSSKGFPTATGRNKGPKTAPVESPRGPQLDGTENGHIFQLGLTVSNRLVKQQETRESTTAHAPQSTLPELLEPTDDDQEEKQC